MSTPFQEMEQGGGIVVSANWLDATTDAYGRITLKDDNNKDLSADDVIVYGTSAGSNGQYCITYVNTSTHKWLAKFINASTGGVITNTAVEYKVVYKKD